MNDEPAAGRDAWVYRNGRRREAGAAASRRLVDAIDRVASAVESRRRAAAVDAAVLAGELEAALADANHPSRDVVARATDAMAAAALGLTVSASVVALELAETRMPETVTIDAPEGFAFYGLHPEAYAKAASAAYDAAAPSRVLVVGVRSIGTTLSAFARVALRRRAVRAERVTVRPSGAPFDRRLTLANEQRAALARASDERARVFVVDEGPGRSGSTLLAVVDAIERAGVARDRIVVVCSRPPDPRRLIAPNAQARWRVTSAIVAPSDVRVPRADRDLSAGRWRAASYAAEDEWPATFASAERRKLLAGEVLYKYEGLGSAAAAARERGRVLADAELAPALHDEGDGWASYRWCGHPLSRGDLDEDVVRHLACYCALRSALFPSEIATEPLEAMTEKNVAVALGWHVRVPRLEASRPAVVDGRMSPCEWIRTPGSLMKVDAIAHGDDHFFPGPTDIAWDLAGVIVEWALDDAAKKAFLRAYRLASGDDPRGRIDAWVGAYAAFRAGLTMLAREHADSAGEAARLDRDLAYYRDALGGASFSWRVASACSISSRTVAGATS
jgi:hypothetical protein